MRSQNDLWEALGAIGEEEAHQLLTRLFTLYEQRLARDSKDPEAAGFFHNLDIVLKATADCNLNRR